MNLFGAASTGYTNKWTVDHKQLTRIQKEPNKKA